MPFFKNKKQQQNTLIISFSLVFLICISFTILSKADAVKSQEADNQIMQAEIKPELTKKPSIAKYAAANTVISDELADWNELSDLNQIVEISLSEMQEDRNIEDEVVVNARMSDIAVYDSATHAIVWKFGGIIPRAEMYSDSDCIAASGYDAVAKRIKKCFWSASIFGRRSIKVEYMTKVKDDRGLGVMGP